MTVVDPSDQRVASNAARSVTVTPWFPNRPGEREGNYIYDSVRAVAGAGWSTSVLVARPCRPRGLRPAFAARESVSFDRHSFRELRHVELVRHLSIPRNLAPGFNDARLGAAVIPALQRLVEMSSAPIIHAHTESLASAAVAVAHRCGAKVVVTIHGINTGKRYFSDAARRERIRTALGAADRVILVGEPLREFFSDLVGRSDHFRVVPNGFSAPATVRREPILQSGRRMNFISVCNLAEGKGVDVTIQALSQLSRVGLANWTYTIVGDGPQKTRIRQMVRLSGLDTQVRFAGAVPHDKVFEYLAAADVFVLPSYREAFGIAYLEAMAAGLLVIAVRGQGPDAFIDDGVSGLLVAPRDPVDLARRLAETLTRPADLQQIAIEGCRRATTEFTWDRHAVRLTQIYSEMLAMPS